MRARVIWFAVFLTAFSYGQLLADTFGSGANQFSIDFVTIGNPGNPADTTGSPNPAGSVPYVYRIGKYEISRSMVEKANAEGSLGITMRSSADLNYAGPDKPATEISWYEAATFVNWLNISTGSVPAYKFDNTGVFQNWMPSDAGFDPTNLYRNRLAHYFLPNVHEWYKAAYYDPTAGVYWDYPTGSNTVPTPTVGGTVPGTAVYNAVSSGPADVYLAGGSSPYGTVGQAGNAWEWEETDTDLANGLGSTDRGIRGGGRISPAFLLRSTGRDTWPPQNAGPNDGFRIAGVAIPEPTSLALFSIAVVMLGGSRRHS